MEKDCQKNEILSKVDGLPISIAWHECLPLASVVTVALSYSVALEILNGILDDTHLY